MQLSVNSERLIYRIGELDIHIQLLEQQLATERMKVQALEDQIASYRRNNVDGVAGQDADRSAADQS